MGFNVLGIGEVLWDMLPSGRQMGGAPANFVCHAAALGARSALISRVGDDDLGREILNRFCEMGVSTAGVQIDHELPTGTVSVHVAADGQPQFTVAANSAWDCIEANEESLRAASTADAICFGTLAQRDSRSRQSIGLILDRVPARALRVLDINLRAPFAGAEVVRETLKRANVLKLNHQELPIVAEMAGLKSTAIAEQLAELTERFSLDLIAVTRGAEGSLLRSVRSETFEHPGVEVHVVDAVGAGDAFTAAMVLGYLQGWTLERISRRANEMAAFVCSQAGATPILPPSVLSRWWAEGS